MFPSPPKFSPPTLPPSPPSTPPSPPPPTLPPSLPPTPPSPRPPPSSPLPPTPSSPAPPPPPSPSTLPSSPPSALPSPDNVQISLPNNGLDNDRAIVQTLLAVNLGCLYTIIQVWTGNRFSLSNNDKILVHAIVFSAVTASFFCIVAHKLLGNPTAAQRKWVVKAALTVTSWDVIGCLCIFLPSVAKLPVMTITSILFSLAIFKLWE